MDFVGYKEDSIIPADGCQLLEIVVGRFDESAFSLNRFYHHGGNGFWIDMLDEKRMQFFRADHITKRHSIDFGRKRPETQFIRFHFARHGHGQQRPTVVGVFKHDNRRPFGMISGDLDSVLDRFGPAA